MNPGIWLRGATALTGTRLQPRRADILIADERIAEIGRTQRTSPQDEDGIDLTGLTLLPGFIDAHVHIGFHPPASVLQGGVTTVRDLGWPPSEIFPLAERSRADDFDGPNILTVGPMLTVPGGYPTTAEWAPEGTGLEIVSRADAEEVVDRLARIGVGFVKIALDPSRGPTLDGSTLGTIVDAARSRGMRTTAHVYGLEQLDKAIDAGVDELAHMLMGPGTIPQRTIERMVGAEMTVVPTLAIRFRKDRRCAIDNLARFVAAGGRAVYGTDLGNEGTRPGIDPREIKGMVKAGFDGMGIVRAATVDAAAYLGLDDRGAIEGGRRADIIGVAGDPLEDPTALLDVRFVARAGRVVKAP